MCSNKAEFSVEKQNIQNYYTFLSTHKLITLKNMIQTLIR